MRGQSPNDQEEYSEAVMQPLEIIAHAPDIMTIKPFLQASDSTTGIGLGVTN